MIKKRAESSATDARVRNGNSHTNSVNLNNKKVLACGMSKIC